MIGPLLFNFQKVLLKAKVLKDIELLKQFGTQLRKPHTDYLTDGIWMCQHDEHSTGLTNGSYLEGLFKIADIKRTWPEISNLKYITDRVLDDKEFTDWYFSKGSTGVSMHDVVAKTVAKICDTIKRIGDEDMKK